MLSLFEERVVSAASEAGLVTLEEIGGLDGIPIDAATSPAFPYVAAALVNAYPDGELPKRAVDLLVGAVSAATSGAALADTCAIVAPVMATASLAPRMRQALRERTQTRATPAEAGLAAIALQALCHLAVRDDSARPAVLDILSDVAEEHAEDVLFAVAATRVAGIAFDHWRDATAVRCLERLTSTAAESDAWFGLAHTQLVDALRNPDLESMMGSVRETLEPFARAAQQVESRADARFYLAIVQFLSAWSAGATVSELEPHLAAASEAAAEFWFDGLGLPERYGWYRPAYDAEFQWLELLHRLRSVAAADNREAWYQAPQALDALASALEAARTLEPATTAAFGYGTLVDQLVEPRIASPFLRKVADLGWLEQWLTENPSEGAERLKDAIDRQLDDRIPEGKESAEDFSAIAQVLGVLTVEREPDLIARVEQALRDKEAVARATRESVVSSAIRAVIDDLQPCLDFVGDVRTRFELLVVTVVRFLRARMDAQRERRFAYLFDPGALESDLAHDLKDWLDGLYSGTILTEVREIGGGRTDLHVQFDEFRFVLELKREKTDASREALRSYLPQLAAYESTDVTLGILIVLDLTPKDAGPANIRDQVWVDVVAGPTADDRGRYAVVVRVPGNRRSPSSL